MTEWFHNQISPPEKNEFRSRFFQDVLNIATQYRDAAISKKYAEPDGQENEQDAQDIVQVPVKKRERMTRQTVERKKPRKNMTRTQRVTEGKTVTTQRVTRAAGKQVQEALANGNTEIDGEKTVVEGSTAGRGNDCG